MGHEISVHFGVADCEQLPDVLTTWHDGITMLDIDDKRPEGERFYTECSRNWYHLYVLNEICADYGLSGLEFLLKEVACVCGDTLDKARAALEALIAFILSNTRSPNPGRYSNNWNLHPTTLALLNDEHHEVDTKRETFEDFFAFIRLLRRAMREAAEQKRCFFFIAPQP